MGGKSSKALPSASELQLDAYSQQALEDLCHDAIAIALSFNQNNGFDKGQAAYLIANEKVRDGVLQVRDQIRNINSCIQTKEGKALDYLYDTWYRLGDSQVAAAISAMCNEKINFLGNKITELLERRLDNPSEAFAEELDALVYQMRNISLSGFRDSSGQLVDQSPLVTASKCPNLVNLSLDEVIDYSRNPENVSSWLR